MAGHADRVRQGLLTRVESADAGPLECLAAARWLTGGDLPLASRFLETGVAHLQEADLARDLQALFQGGERGPALLQQLGRVWTDAPEADAEALMRTVPAQGARLLRLAYGAWRTETNRPPGEVLLGLLSARWNEVEEAMRTALEAQPPGVREPRTPAGQLMRGKALASGALGAPDLAAAVPWIRRAAEGGYGEARLVYGDLLVNGQGVARDVEQGIRWYRQAAEQKVPHAGCRLGRLYLAGNGVPADNVEAARWLGLETEHDCADALFLSGLIVVQSNPPDWEAAGGWFRRAAKLDHPPAKYFLGKYCEQAGRVREALDWYEAAARGGVVEAQADLGDRLSDGFTPGQNDREAYVWLWLAVQGGHRPSEAVLKRVEGELTADQVTDARRRASAILAKVRPGK